MEIIIELGQENDIDEVEKLYNELNDYLAKGINYAGWQKGIYPTREEAIKGIKNKNLFVAKNKGIIVGTLILNHEYETAYDNAKWQIDIDYSDVFVIHTFAVHPNFMKCNVGKVLMDFVYKYSVEVSIKSIRLDVHEANIPAISLYEKCGFKYIDTVDLGLGEYGLKWFKVYEKLVINK